jgi:hypothetical protein
MRINFAWENNLNDLETSQITEAMNAISRSKTIVIIGYSFPLYNRLVDLKYFNSKKLSSKILYIQDPKADEISKSIISNFSLNTDRSFAGKTGMIEYVQIETIKNCDSFFVPSDIF